MIKPVLFLSRYKRIINDSGEESVIRCARYTNKPVIKSIGIRSVNKSTVKILKEKDIQSKLSQKKKQIILDFCRLIKTHRPLNIFDHNNDPG